MRLDRARKSEIVGELREKFTRARAAFIAHYSGIKVEEMTRLRKSLREASVEFKVVRNTLARLALEETRLKPLSEHFRGPVAVALSYRDAVLAAKALTEFAKDQPNFKLKVGALGEKVIGLDEIKALAELPPREVLLGKLLGLLKGVPGGFVGVLSGVPRKFLYALSAIQEAKEA